MREANRRNWTAPNINVTPLIDVLLVLLIIFMVISPAKPKRFETRLPEKTQNDQAVPELSLVVTVAPGGYKLNSTDVGSLTDLSNYLHEALDGRPSDRRTVFVKAARGLAYAKVVDVIDAVKTGGGAPIGLQLEALD